MIYIKFQFALSEEPPGRPVNSIEEARQLLHAQVDNICDVYIAKQMVKKQREEKNKGTIDPFRSRN